MEENKNNAIEKVEQVSNDNAQKYGTNTVQSEAIDNHTNSQPTREQIRADRQREKEKKSLEKSKKEAQKLRAKHLKQEQKAQTKKTRQEQRSRKRKGKKDNGKGGWLSAVITLGIATLALASVLTYMLIMPSSSDMAMESAYRRSFYDTVEQVDNIDLNLSKAIATTDQSAMMKYLMNTAINSEVAENDIQSLPLQDENKFYTTKIVNQIGDYSKYLTNKLARGESLSQSDYAGLNQLYKANLQFKNSLQLMMKDMGQDFSFSSISEGALSNSIVGGFNDLQNLSVEYPELIYDGPFSDGQNNREIKGLSGEEISAKRAKDIFLSMFSSYQIDAVESAGETGGKIDCYNISASADGDLIYGQISKVGGKLIMFSYAGQCNAVNYEQEYAEEKAIDFLRGIGVDSMKAVWINLANNVYTVNCAYDQKGIIVYADLIKVRICADSGNVIGLEANGYYTNHTERVIPSAVLSERQAMAKVSDTISIETSRLALVPEGQSAERLCYEFSGVSEGRTYYVYIDAITGRQVEMFKVIESTEGTLLM